MGLCELEEELCGGRKRPEDVSMKVLELKK